MTGFKNFTDKIIEDELSIAFKQGNAVLERDFKDYIHKQYGLSMPTLSGALERTASNLGLIRRHLTNELKNYYGLSVPGHPAAYMKDI